MKKFSGSVLLMLLFLCMAIAGAAVVAVAGINVVQRAVGAHTVEAQEAAAQQGRETSVQLSDAAASGRSTTATTTTSAAERQEWADEKVDQWLAVYGDSSVSDLVEPYRHVEGWFAPADGELELLASSSNISDSRQLATIAGEVMRRLAALDETLQAVTVSTSDGALSETVER